MARRRKLSPISVAQNLVDQLLERHGGDVKAVLETLKRLIPLALREPRREDEENPALDSPPGTPTVSKPEETEPTDGKPSPASSGPSRPKKKASRDKTPSAQPKARADAGRAPDTVSGGVSSHDPAHVAALAAALPGNERLTPAFTRLVDSALDTPQDLEVLGELVARAGLDVMGLPVGGPRSDVFASLPPAEAQAVSQPWMDLISSIRPSGALLTDDALQVDAAVTLGLLRKAHGNLTVTKAGEVAAGDPIRLWRHLADRLTTGVPRLQPLVAVVALLATADQADRSASETFLTAGQTLRPHLLPANVPADNVSNVLLEHSRTVWTVLEVSGGVDSAGRATPAGRRLARAALLV